MAVVKVEKNSYSVDPLYQWDLNRTLEIRGLSMAAAPEIHFTNDAMVRALRCYSEMDAAGVIRVGVPNSLLQKPYKIKAIVCIREGDVFKSYREIVIPVKARPKPADYTITGDDEIYSFNALEDLVYKTISGLEQSNAEMQEDLTTKVNTVTTQAAQAETTANTAKTTADAAAKTANGIAGTASQALSIAKEVKNAHFYNILTVTAEGWTGDAAPYTQTVTVENILGTDRPHYGPVYSEDLETALMEKEGWTLVDDLDTADGSVKLTCFEEKPAVDITVQLEVHR